MDKKQCNVAVRGRPQTASEFAQDLLLHLASTGRPVSASDAHQAMQAALELDWPCEKKEGK